MSMPMPMPPSSASNSRSSKSCRPYHLVPESEVGRATSSSDEITWLGSKDTGMVVISAPRSDPDGVVDLLGHLNSALQKEGVREQLDRLIDDEDESVRLIQAGRYELFLYASGKESKAFDQIAQGMPADTKRRILSYAVKAASREPRLKGGSYEFGNFSLIANYDPVPAQLPHVDVVLPNYQFGLIVTDKTPGTQFAEVETSVRTVEALVELWGRVGTEIGQALPPNLAIALKADSIVREVVASFGDVLLPQESFQRRMTGCTSLSTGTLLSLPGNVIHSGPMSNDFRAILFFSAWPRGSEIDAYDPDTQFSGVTLSGHIVDLLWRQPNVEYDERLFLLRMFARYISQSNVPNMFSHFSEGELSNYVRTIERADYPKDMSKDEYVKKVARKKSFCPPRQQFVDNERVGVMVDIGGSKCVSINDLLTKWKGREYGVTVYRKKDGSIFLHYPGVRDPETGSECFEGAGDGDRFTLTMHGWASEGRLFDGSNGVLRDTWQKPIRCFRRSDARAEGDHVGDQITSFETSPRMTSSARKKSPYAHLERREDPRSAGRAQCGLCDACMVEDCGSCVNCKDMKRFGGPNKIRQKCMHRPPCDKHSSPRSSASANSTRAISSPSATRPSRPTVDKPRGTSNGFNNGTPEKFRSSQVPKKNAYAHLERRMEPRSAGRTQCGTCDACMVEDCGSCVNCMDMKRFGGPNKIRQRCMHRPPCSTHSSAGTPLPSAKRKNPYAHLGRRRVEPRTAGRTQCGSCDACMVEDCGTCVHCKDMKRFGGPNKIRQRCLHRPTCGNLVGR